MNSRVIGLDLSLRSSGVASSLGWVDCIQPKTTGMERLRIIRAEVLSLLGPTTDLVVVEGPSFGSTQGQQHELGGLWWCVMEAVDARGVRWVEVSPSTLKKYATGRGNAGKDAVLTAAVRRFPNIEVRGNDEADALWLAAIGTDLLGEPMVEMPQAHRAALAKLRLPEALEVAGA